MTSTQRFTEIRAFLSSLPNHQVYKKNTSYLLSKRLIDIVVASSIILLIMPWLSPIVALLIKLNSKGPIFFVQKRTGKDNKTFHCIKFRTMKLNKEADTQQAITNDLRITRLGKILRLTHIDELPQLLNVLMGTMSIVGPRPHMLYHTDPKKLILSFF